MFKHDFTFTKKQLGYLLVFVGVASALAILSIDVLSAGREGGIGPAQRMALGLAVAVAVVGLTLVPLGDDTA